MTGVPCSVPTCTTDGTRWAHEVQRVHGPPPLPRVRDSAAPRGVSPYASAQVPFNITIPRWVCDHHAHSYQEQGYLIQPPTPAAEPLAHDGARPPG